MAKHQKLWTKEEDEILTKYYPTETNVENILKLLPGRNWDTAACRARRLGLGRDLSYTKNELFFEIPDLKNCWAAGYISADGNLKYDKKCYRLILACQEDDVDIIEEFKKIANHNGVIYKQDYKFKIPTNYGKNAGGFNEGVSKMTVLRINKCKKWHEDLERNWNLTKQKVYRIIPPNTKDLSLNLAFVSGLIDGDGSIRSFYVEEENANRFNINIIGTYNLVEWVKEIFDKIAPRINGANLIKEKNCKSLYIYNIGGVKAYIISKMILSLDIYHMKRKWQKARYFIDLVENLKISKRFLSSLKETLTPEIISFVKGTNQEFSEDFLIKIGYLDKNNENSNSQFSNLVVNSIES